MNMTYESNELYHFGIKGMKWGVRNSKRSGGGIGRRIKKKYALNPDPKKERREVEGNPDLYKYEYTGGAAKKYNDMATQARTHQERNRYKQMAKYHADSYKRDSRRINKIGGAIIGTAGVTALAASGYALTKNSKAATTVAAMASGTAVTAAYVTLGANIVNEFKHR